MIGFDRRFLMPGLALVIAGASTALLGRALVVDEASVEVDPVVAITPLERPEAPVVAATAPVEPTFAPSAIVSVAEAAVAEAAVPGPPPSIAQAPPARVPSPDELWACLDGEREFAQRIRILDAFVASCPAELAAPAIEDLLDRPIRTLSEFDARRHRVEFILRLGGFQDTKSEGGLLALASTREASKEERLAALEALRRRGVRTEVAAVVKALADHDGDLDVRRAAARALTHG